MGTGLNRQLTQRNLKCPINTRSSRSLINKYMQMESKGRYLTPFQTGKVEKDPDIKCWRRREISILIDTMDYNINWFNHLRDQFDNIKYN